MNDNGSGNKNKSGGGNRMPRTINYQVSWFDNPNNLTNRQTEGGDVQCGVHGRKIRSKVELIVYLEEKKRVDPTLKAIMCMLE